MVKPRPQSKKNQKKGVDFKKIRRKIGRKLPPPKTTTNTEVKAKSIILPEQSIAADKDGLALSKKGLTLKELLQQTSHHNARIRKDALLGVKDILIKHPAELKLHKIAIVEKLRERIGDDNKVVSETLYQLFKSEVFPGCPKENQGPLVSLMMAYIFNAMTHLTIDVRLMAFKFFDLVVQYYPSSFSIYAEKVLQNYEDILRKNQFLEDKVKLKSILTGLMQGLSLLPSNEKEDHPTTKNDTPAHGILHAYDPEVHRKPIGLTDLIKKSKNLLPILVGRFQDFMPLMHATSQLDTQSCDCMQLILQNIDLIVRFLVSESEPDLQILPTSQKPDVTASGALVSPNMLKKLWDLYPLNLVHLTGKDDNRIFMLNTVITKIYLQLSNWNYSPSALLEKFMEFIESSLSIKIQTGRTFHEKHLLPLIPFIPKLTMQISGDWKSRILQAFTEAFRNCSPESPMKLACLSAIQEMLAPERSYLDASDPAMLYYQIAWIQEIPSLLILLDDKKPSCSKAVLDLLLCVGKAAPANSPLSQEFENMQYSFREFFSREIDEATCYGPFIRLGADIQELAICCLYYFSFMDSQILQSLVLCCVCKDIEPNMIFRILEALHSAFRAGHIQVADYSSFHVTLLSRFQFNPEKTLHKMADVNSKWRTFKSVTSAVCTSLSQIGDDYLVLQMLEKIIVDQICGEIPMENKCAFLRVLVTLDSKPTRLSDQSIVNLSNVLPQYLVDIVSNCEGSDHESTSEHCAKRRQYYLLPSFYLFHRSRRLLTLVLKVMESWVSNVSPSSDHFNPSIDRTTRVCAIASVLLHLYHDVKIRPIMLSCKTEIENLLQNFLNVLSSKNINLNLEERHKFRTAYDRVRACSQ